MNRREAIAVLIGVPAAAGRQVQASSLPNVTMVTDVRIDGRAVAQAIAEMRSGIFTPNEIRARNGLEPLGD